MNRFSGSVAGTTISIYDSKSRNRLESKGFRKNEGNWTSLSSSEPTGGVMVTTILVSIGAVTFSLLVLGGGAAALFTYLRQNIPEKATGFEHAEARIAALEVKIEGFPSLWEEERKRAKRSQDSARKSHEAAASKLEEVQELIDENANVPTLDGVRGEEGEVHYMPPRLGDAPAPDVADRVAAIAHLLR